MNIKTAESPPRLFVVGTKLRDGKFSSDNLIIPKLFQEGGRGGTIGQSGDQSLSAGAAGGNQGIAAVVLAVIFFNTSL